MTASEIFTQWDSITAAASEKVAEVEAAMKAALANVDRQLATVDAERRRLETELHKRQDDLANAQTAYRRCVTSGLNTEAAAAALAKADNAVKAIEARLTALDGAVDVTVPDELTNAVTAAEMDLNAVRERFHQSRHDFREELQREAQQINEFLDRLLYSDVRPTDSGIRQRYDRLVLHKEPETEKPSGFGFSASRQQVATEEEMERYYQRR